MRAAPATGLTRSHLPGATLVSVFRGTWTEHFLTVVPLPDEDLHATLMRAASVVADNSVTVLKLTVFGSLVAYDEAVTLLKSCWEGGDWPMTWVQGGSTDTGPIAGILLHGLTGLRVDTLWQQGRAVGRTYADETARYAVLGDVRADGEHPTRQSEALATFEAVQAALDTAGLSFSDTIRTWLYVDGILDWYSGLNAARDRFFAANGVYDGLVPASTGIGCANPHGVAVVAEALAFRPTAGECSVTAVPSPLQCSALRYGSAFSRAIDCSVDSARSVLVSGTAAITPDGRSAHAGDVASQVGLTMRVVEELLRSRGMRMRDVTRAVAYFPSAGDASVLDSYRDIVPVPIVAVEAMVCRGDLLFELELDAIRA